MLIPVVVWELMGMCLVVGSGGAEEDIYTSGTPGEAVVLLGQMKLFAGSCQSSVSGCTNMGQTGQGNGVCWLRCRSENSYVSFRSRLMPEVVALLLNGS